jgi:hypothetical protein
MIITMNKYIPKVGEECEVLNATMHRAEYERCEPLYMGEYIVVYTSSSCIERTSQIEVCTFRPIQTKADVEREQLVGIMRDTSMERGDFYAAVSVIQQAGFTIPKKIKRSDVHKEVCNCLENTSLNQRINLADAICELLGDLVEQDDKGGEL